MPAAIFLGKEVFLVGIKPKFHVTDPPESSLASGTSYNVLLTQLPWSRIYSLASLSCDPEFVVRICKLLQT